MAANDRRKGLVAYYRVSTDKQGRSGLGLEAQQARVAEYAQRTGLYVLAAYTEVESGRNDQRAELKRALAHARRSKAPLVVAKLDRLTRSVRMYLELAESNVDIVLCDIPDLPKGPLGQSILTIIAMVGELEVGMISERTKAAMAAYKARGGVLGSRRPESTPLTAEARQKGQQAAGMVSSARAREAYDDIAPMMAQWRTEGLTLRAIADRLNTEGYTTRNDAAWSATQVMRVLGMA